MKRGLGLGLALAAAVALSGVSCTSIADPHARVGGGDGTANGDGGATQSLAPGETVQPRDTGSDGGDGAGLETQDPRATIVSNATINVQLAEPASGRFGGLFAADAQGFFEDRHIDDLINEPSATGKDPLAVASAPDGPEFYVGPAVGVMKARESGSDLVNVAQLLGRSGERFVSLATSGIAALGDLRAKRATVLRSGFDNDALIAITVAGLARHDVHLSRQPFNPDLLLAGATDAAQVRYEDEWASLLETDNPATGELFQPADLTVIDLTANATRTLQDGIYARASWLAQPGNVELAARFLEAVFQGYAWCRDNLDDCAQLTVEAGARTEAQHQKWVINQVDAEIWPSTAGLGVLDATDWKRTADLAKVAGLISADPPAAAARSDLAAAAIAALPGVDLKAPGFTPVQVQITEGGADPEPTE